MSTTGGGDGSSCASAQSPHASLKNSLLDHLLSRVLRRYDAERRCTTDFSVGETDEESTKRTVFTFSRGLVGTLSEPVALDKTARASSPCGSRVRPLWAWAPSGAGRLARPPLSASTGLPMSGPPREHRAGWAASVRAGVAPVATRPPCSGHRRIHARTRDGRATDYDGQPRTPPRRTG